MGLVSNLCSAQPSLSPAVLVPDWNWEKLEVLQAVLHSSRFNSPKGLLEPLPSAPAPAGLPRCSLLLSPSL